MLRKLFPKTKLDNPLSIGIDFGTTISRICYIDSRSSLFGMPEITPIASIISVHKSVNAGRRYEWRVGERALNWFDYVTRIKLQIDAMEPISVSKELKIRPEVLAARLISELKSKACEFNKELRQIEKVTISVPAEWSVIQRQATIMAANIAGFSDVNLIEEPVAAFLALAAFKKDQINAAKNILVFDCGGGTLDITVIINDLPKIPYVAGRATNIGEIAGENIDDQLSQELIGKNNWETLLTPPEQREFSGVVVRQLKEQINPINLSHDPLDHAPRHKEVRIGNLFIPAKKLSLTLEQHNKVVNPIALEATKFLKSALNNCVIDGKPKSLLPSDIDLVIMVGGSSYLRPLQEVVQRFFNKKIDQKEIILYEPDKLVASGSALWQAFQDRGENKFTPTLAMDTYLSYKRNINGTAKDEKEYLGHAGDILPISMPNSLIDEFRAPVLDIPQTTKKNLEWYVYQKFSYSIQQPAVPVEWIKYQVKSDKKEKVRLKYKIDTNGNISIWKPSFIFAQGEEITPELDSLYNWAKEKPETIASEFDVRKI